MAIRVKAKETSGIVEVKALMNHPMETGQRKDKATGELVPAHYINKVEVMAGDKKLLEANWGPSVSANPYLSFNYKGKAGDKIKVTWTDNKGGTDSGETEVTT
ncbi:thiosulfate oxidation carrier complex protein SoxZ [Thiolinea disciformis]|uniref:thiosulfate oxidation carrier complex protein SoxZ n=1 Tax=Thiolinea disciformis TaxID=125614 RepID=UPI0003740918|nr:thiosulfate oxidation carrier complex protein SoxZ [Thiolinea disciformis]